MPNCFMLKDKETGQPAGLQKVDDAMREHFGAEPSDTEWYLGWYDTIGLGLAMGHSLEKLRTQMFANTRLVPVIEWMEEHYTTDCWAER